ncbi:MAG: tetratricopeptide repeat protein [Gemmatimonadota bacterium]
MTAVRARRRIPALLPLLLSALALATVSAAGCSRLPRIVVLEDPLSAREHLDLGVAYERKGELDLAAREYGRALRKDAGLVQARVNLGNVRLAQKKYGDARREYLRALETRPGDLEAENNLAWVAILSGEGIGDALQRLEGALAAGTSRPPAVLDTVGVLRMRANRPGDAEAAFAEAESACEALRAGQGEAGCPEATLREIRDHRRELGGRFPGAPLPPSLVK